MFTEASRTGAAAMSRVARKNPTELLRQMREADRTASPEHLFRKWCDIVRDDDDYLSAALHHAFTNINTTLERDENKTPPTAKQTAERRASEQAKVSALKERVAKIVLMNIMLPTGKLLRESTFADCKKAGGWFAKVAAKGKPNQVVGRTLSEVDLQKL